MTLCRRSPRPYGLIGAVALAMTGSMLVGSTPALAQKSGGPTDRQQTAQAAQAPTPQAPTPQAPRRAPVPASAGSRGAGDPYFPTYGNGGYRVRHYNVDASFSPATERLHGRTVISARATKNLSRFNLDLVLPASKVTVNGLPAKHRHTRHELIVKPRHQLLRGQPMRVVVRYGGVPKNHKVGGAHPWVTTKDGAVAVGEPEIAAWWFPSNDHPSDKATFDITLHVPRGVEAISNGRLVRKRTAGKRSVWHWSENDPMATYLAFAAIGQYDIVRGHTAGGRPYLYAYSKQLKHQRFARKSVGQTGRITAWLQRTWGAYPFHQIGGVVLGKWIGFALENQTRPVYSRAFFEFSRDRRTVAHEMAHQWFGDKVSVDNWRDIWLNEGFATYTEWLYQHHIAGASVDTIFKRKYASNPRKSGFWNVHVGAPGRHRLFSAPIYDRGAMTLHALRHKIGSRAFFRLARSWVRNTDGNGSTREFVHAAERVSGQQLDRFFHVWLSTGSRPRSTVANGFPRTF